MPPSVTELVNLRDTNGDRFFLTRLDRATGSRGYLAAIRTRLSPDAAVILGVDEFRGSCFLDSEGLIRLRQAIDAELAGENL